MKWKFLGVLGVMIGMVIAQPLVSEVAYAGPGDDEAETAVCDKPFLFFKPWYAGLCEIKEKDDGKKEVELVPVCEKSELECKSGFGDEYVSLATFVWTIVLNVIFDLTLAIGYIAMVMMVYGGYLYIMSQGDPSKMAKGKKTLVTAVTGVVLGLAASVLVNTVIQILGIDRSAGFNQGTNWTKERVTDIFNYAYSMAGIVAVIFIIKSGIDYMISVGDPAKTSKATRSLIYAVVGLVIVILAVVITNFIVSSVAGAL